MPPLPAEIVAQILEYATPPATIFDCYERYLCLGDYARTCRLWRKEAFRILIREPIVFKPYKGVSNAPKLLKLLQSSTTCFPTVHLRVQGTVSVMSTSPVPSLDLLVALLGRTLTSLSMSAVVMSSDVFQCLPALRELTLQKMVFDPINSPDPSETHPLSNLTDLSMHSMQSRVPDILLISRLPSLRRLAIANHTHSSNDEVQFTFQELVDLQDQFEFVSYTAKVRRLLAPATQDDITPIADKTLFLLEHMLSVKELIPSPDVKHVRVCWTKFVDGNAHQPLRWTLDTLTTVLDDKFPNLETFVVPPQWCQSTHFDNITDLLATRNITLLLKENTHCLRGETLISEVFLQHLRKLKSERGKKVALDLAVRKLSS